MPFSTEDVLHALNARSSAVVNTLSPKTRDLIGEMQRGLQKTLSIDTAIPYLQTSLATKIKAVGDEKSGMYYSCIATAKQADLANDVVDPMGCVDWLEKGFKANPITLYQHNHEDPIGHTMEFRVTPEAVVIDKAMLSAIPKNIDIIWPMLSDGTLRGVSNGFFVLDGKSLENGLYMFTKWYWIEKSLVSVPCLPVALVTSVFSDEQAASLSEVASKELEQVREDAYHTLSAQLSGDLNGMLAKYFDPLRGVIEAYEKGQASKILKFTCAPVTDNQPSAKPEPDAGVEEFTMPQKHATKSHETVPHVMDQPHLPAVSKSHKQHAEINDSIHLIKEIDTAGKVTYKYRIGHPTQRGYTLDEKLLKTAVCRFLGARSAEQYDLELKRAVIERISECYIQMQWTMPTLGGIALDLLSEHGLEDLKYQDVEFHEKENQIFTASEFSKAISEVSSMLAKIEKGEMSSDLLDAEQIRKEFYAYIDLFGRIETPADQALAAKLMEVLAANQVPEAPEPEIDPVFAASVLDVLKRHAPKSDDQPNAD